MLLKVNLCDMNGENCFGVEDWIIENPTSVLWIFMLSLLLIYITELIYFLDFKFE